MMAKATKLPGVLSEISEIVGLAAALAIATRVGGTRIYLPAEVDADHWLVHTIGRADADKLCAHFAIGGRRRRGQSLDIPLHVGGTYRQMMRAIAETVHKLDDGETSSHEIARKAGVTQRSVHRHRARHRGDDKKSKQGRLF